MAVPHVLEAGLRLIALESLSVFIGVPEIESMSQ